jgi:hypothetical protein
MNENNLAKIPICTYHSRPNLFGKEELETPSNLDFNCRTNRAKANVGVRNRSLM